LQKLGPILPTFSLSNLRSTKQLLVTSYYTNYENFDEPPLDICKIRANLLDRLIYAFISIDEKKNTCVFDLPIDTVTT